MQQDFHAPIYSLIELIHFVFCLQRVHSPTELLTMIHFRDFMKTPTYNNLMTIGTSIGFPVSALEREMLHWLHTQLIEHRITL
jgi:hypothetical protein